MAFVIKESEAPTMKIDVFPHIAPPRFVERVRAIDPRWYTEDRHARWPALVDLEARLRIMDDFPGYVQVLTLSQPPLDRIGDGSTAIELARRANDEMAEACVRHPERFLGFAAALPLAFVDDALIELDRAMDDLGALGAQIHTNVCGMPLDEPRFAPFWARMEQRDALVWVHPMRTADFADYAAEPASKFGAFIALGWPHETSVFMFRLVYSGIIERHPGLRILTHHCGGTIPYLGQRADVGERADTGRGAKRDPVGLLKRFHADTALGGNVAALACGVSFFGVDHVLFGTDMPYGREGGVAHVRDAIADVSALDVTPEERSKVFEHNARRVLGLDGTGGERRMRKR